MNGVYRIADHNIGIESHFPGVHRMCADYRIEGQPEIVISVGMDELNEAWNKIELQIKDGELPEREHSLEYLEAVRVYKRIAEQTPFWDIFMLHGSAIAVDGVGYVFSAKSGTGKSTHSRLWRTFLGNRAEMVNDDKPLIKVLNDGTATVYGTPWDGKHKLGKNIAVSLKAICMLERSRQNWIREADKTEIYPILLQQVYRPYNIKAMDKTLDLVGRLNVKFYRMGCNMDINAAELAYNAMKG